MEPRHYAFLVEIDKENNLFEIFDILTINGVSEERAERWKNSFANNNVSVICVNNFKSISIGSKIVNDEVILDFNQEPMEIAKDRDTFVFLDKDKVFGLISHLKDSFESGKYLAALSQKTIALDITGKGVGLGWIWDGSSFMEPLE